jgi:hypothetical protein
VLSTLHMAVGLGISHLAVDGAFFGRSSAPFSPQATYYSSS